MEGKYLYETFSAASGAFDGEFTRYLNGKREDGWKVKHCSVCHGEEEGKMWRACLFKRHH